MFKNPFGHKDQNSNKMSHEEALEIVMREYNRNRENELEIEDKSTNGYELEDYAESIIVANQEMENFILAGEITSIIKAMRLEVQKLVDPDDVEKIEQNRKLSEAITVLSKSSRPEITVYSMAIGAKIAIILFFLGICADNSNGSKLDIETRMNLFFAGIASGAVGGLLVSESGFRKRREEEMSNSQIAEELIKRNGISRKLKLPESLASQVDQHIANVEYESVFEKLDDK
jgi:hypothetical protein